MSTVLLGTADYPIRFKNSSGGSIPAYNIFKCASGARLTRGDLIFTGTKSSATGSEALFVNSGLATADNGYGWCRPVTTGPFWVKYNGTVANGDVVGPVSGQTYVSTAGTGLVVIFKDTDKGLVLCEMLAGTTTVSGSPGFWTIAELDPATGAIVQTFDRGVSRDRELAADVCLLLGSDGTSLYAAGSSSTNGGFGYLRKYNIDSGALLWESDDGALHQVAPRNPSPSTTRIDQILCEADDGAIWLCRGGQHSDTTLAAKPPYVTRYDPDTGSATHQYGSITALGWALYPDTSGAIVVASPVENALRRLDATAALTHTRGSLNFTAMCDDGAGSLIIVDSATIKVIAKSDLSVTTTATPLVGETFLAVASDGTTIYTSTTAATPKYRAYNYSLVEQWNGNRDTTAATSWELKAVNSKLYDFSTCVRKINPASGAEVWQSSPSTGFGTVIRRTATALGSDFTISGHVTAIAQVGSNSTDATGLVCCEESTGATRWFDNVTVYSVVVSPDDRIFACHNRRGHTLSIAS